MTIVGVVSEVITVVDVRVVGVVISVPVIGVDDGGVVGGVSVVVILVDVVVNGVV